MSKVHIQSREVKGIGWNKTSWAPVMTETWKTVCLERFRCSFSWASCCSRWTGRSWLTYCWWALTLTVKTSKCRLKCDTPLLLVLLASVCCRTNKEGDSGGSADYSRTSAGWCWEPLLIRSGKKVSFRRSSLILSLTTNTDFIPALV